MEDRAKDCLVIIHESTVKKYEKNDIIDIINDNISPTINIIKNSKQETIKANIINAQQKNIILVGGHKTIPFFQVPNPVNDSDPFVFSDLPYVSREMTKYLMPDKGICRIPDDDYGTSEDFLPKVLNNKFNIKTQGEKYNMSNYGAKAWEGILVEMEKIFATNKHIVSPPENKSTIGDKVIKDKDILYFNLHGVMSKGDLFGQEGKDFPSAFSPQNVVLNNTLAILTSCYGGYIIGRNINTSVPLSLLYNGCPCVFCSTNISYGTARPPFVLADMLIILFLNEMLKGNIAIEAFFTAKKEYLVNTITNKGRITNEDKKTLLQFNLYGNPFTTLANSSGKTFRN